MKPAQAALAGPEGQLCAVAGCDRPAHGRSALCRGHKERRLLDQDLSTPLRAYVRDDPERAVLEALRRWQDAVERRRQQLDAQFQRQDEFHRLLALVKKEAEASAEDEAEWKRARAALRQALQRYHATRASRTRKHKQQARRRR